ncbi:MAG TPA: FKBP-type peptidyl-prolyl cis-trans isomerase [Edaphocola sp.]|nr:FKBP-type peptidyl-prolyl cis-trans isomerase [Edaphocola sp.]
MNITKFLLTSTIAVSMSLGAFAQEFQTYPGGLEYQIIKKGTGTYIGKPGDIGQMHIIFMIGDSTILNSRVMNNNIPFDQPLMEPATENDVFVGINKMVDGEVSTFRIKADDFFKNNGQDMPSWVNHTDYASWNVEMVKVQNKEEVESMAKKKAEEQDKTDEAIILKVLKDKKIAVKAIPKNGITKANPKVAYKDNSGIYYIVTHIGNGVKAEPGKMASMNYTGSLLDGTVFDSNIDPAFNHVQPIEFKVDGKQMIKGWDRMAVLMNVGQKVQVFIPSSQAYGPQARQPHIKENSILKFDMELLEIK